MIKAQVTFRNIESNSIHYKTFESIKLMRKWLRLVRWSQASMFIQIQEILIYKHKSQISL